MAKSQKPFAWPWSIWDWYWMRCRTSKRAKWRVVLVQLISNEHGEFVAPHEDNNAFDRHCCARLEATFLPAQAPPEKEAWGKGNG